LIGDTVNYQRVFNGTSIPNVTLTVGAGIEFDEGQHSIDISESNISLLGGNQGGWWTYAGSDGIRQYIEISSLDWVDFPTGVITGIDVDFGGPISSPDSSAPAFSAADVTFTEHTVRIQIGGLDFEPGSFVSVELLTSHVPIPPALWLFGSGLLGMIGIARRKRVA
jgi:hypothetical protein